MFIIITSKQQKFYQSDPVLIWPKFASVLIQFDPVLTMLISDAYLNRYKIDSSLQTNDLSSSIVEMSIGLDLDLNGSGL